MNSLLPILVATPIEPKVKSFVVFRLTTTQWISGERITQKKELRLMRSLSRNWDGTFEYLNEDIQSVGMFPINNLDGLDDGLYILCSREHKDWESGIVDEVEFFLSKYEP